MRSIKSLVLCLFILLIAPPHGVAGTIIFSNLVQPGDEFAPDGIAVGSNPFFPGFPLGIAATRFTPGLSSLLDSIEVPLFLVSGPTVFDAFLMTQTAGHPGTIIESYILTSVAAGNLTLIPSSLHPTLTAGTPYWFAVTTGPESFGFWRFTTFQGDAFGSPNFATGSFSGGVVSDWTLGTGGPTGREGALKIVGNEVPEPASGVLVGIGLLVCGWWLRPPKDSRRRG